jgi:hypothetical protein
VATETSMSSQLNRVGPIKPGAKGLNTDAEISIEFAGPQLHSMISLLTHLCCLGNSIYISEQGVHILNCLKQ